MLFSNINGTVITTNETYFDKELKKLQCNKGRLRSFDDILEIVNTYFPSITPKRLIHELLVFDPPKYINTIDGLNTNYSDCNKLNSKYSWHELLAMLGIKNYEEYKKYVLKHRSKIKKV